MRKVTSIRWIGLSLLLVLAAIVFWPAGSGTVFAQPPDEAPVTFPDPNLEATIREVLNKPEGAIYASELESITILVPKAAEELLYFAPEPKSPHGVDISPGGEYMVVSGKLDPHVTIYSFDKVLSAIDAGGFKTDDYGIPILAFDDVVESQVEVGLGPLHTQFGPDGYAYTSLFLEPAVARWTMGGEYED